MEGSFSVCPHAPLCSCLDPRPSSCPPFPFNGMKNEGRKEGGRNLFPNKVHGLLAATMRDEKVSGLTKPASCPQHQHTQPVRPPCPRAADGQPGGPGQIARHPSDRLSTSNTFNFSTKTEEQRPLPFITADEPAAHTASLHRCTAPFCPRCFHAVLSEAAASVETGLSVGAHGFCAFQGSEGSLKHLTEEWSCSYIFNSFVVS